MLLNVGSGGGAAAAPVSGGGAAGGDAAAPAADAKEEEKPKEEGRNPFVLFSNIKTAMSLMRLYFSRQGRIRRRYGFRAFRLECHHPPYVLSLGC